MIAGPLLITPHAVDQYRARYAPHLSRQEALTALIDLAKAARYKRTEQNGAQLWKAPGKAGIRLIAVQNPGTPVPSVVTVLPRHRRSQSQGLRAREDSAACLPVAPS